jgi:hypothetical protein
MTVDDLEIPPNATIRQEYVKGGNPQVHISMLIGNKIRN